MVTADRWKCYFAIADAIAKHEQRVMEESPERMMKGDNEGTMGKLVTIDEVSLSNSGLAGASCNQKILKPFKSIILKSTEQKAFDQEPKIEQPEENQVPITMGKWSKLFLPML